MSLEEKFSALTVDDAASVVDLVKKQGAEKSGYADNVSVLAARCDSKDDAEALAALKTVAALAKECPGAQAFTKECLGACKYSSLVVVIRRSELQCWMVDDGSWIDRRLGRNGRILTFWFVAATFCLRSSLFFVSRNHFQA